MMGVPYEPTQMRGAGGGMVRSDTLPHASYVNAQEADRVGEKCDRMIRRRGGKNAVMG